MRVLGIDDDADLRAVLAEVLASEGHQVDTVPAGLEALDALGVAVPDVILLDQMLPDVTGPTFLRMLRGHPDAANVPVIVVSGAPASAETRAIADGYLAKPFDIDEIVALVRRAVRRTGG
jgi:DNA-binding response OmpR family regulator